MCRNPAVPSHCLLLAVAGSEGTQGAANRRRRTRVRRIANGVRGDPGFQTSWEIRIHSCRPPGPGSEPSVFRYVRTGHISLSGLWESPRNSDHLVAIFCAGYVCTSCLAQIAYRFVRQSPLRPTPICRLSPECQSARGEARGWPPAMVENAGGYRAYTLNFIRIGK
jgi:hypothetical protein